MLCETSTENNHPRVGSTNGDPVDSSHICKHHQDGGEGGREGEREREREERERERRERVGGHSTKRETKRRKGRKKWWRGGSFTSFSSHLYLALCLGLVQVYYMSESKGYLQSNRLSMLDKTLEFCSMWNKNYGQQQTRISQTLYQHLGKNREGEREEEITKNKVQNTTFLPKTSQTNFHD